MKIVGIFLIIVGALIILAEIGLARSESYLLADPTKKTTIDYGTKHILGFPARITFIIDGNSVIRKIFTSHTDSFNLEEIIEFIRKLQAEASVKDKTVN